MKMNKLFIFVLGAAAGSLVTLKIVEEKYKKIADEEIASVVEQLKNRFEEKETEKEEPETVTLFADGVPVDTFVKNEEMDKYEKLVQGYKGEDGTVEKEQIKPYVISPEEFGEFGNDTISLTYYSDFVLADEDDEIIVDPESIIGDALEHFGEYEDDAVHVRNENVECDYEILKSEKTFSEVYKEEN